MRNKQAPNKALAMYIGFLVTTQNARETTNVIIVKKTPDQKTTTQIIPISVIGKKLDFSFSN